MDSHTTHGSADRPDRSLNGARGRFEGVVLTKLDDLDERVTELIELTREIQRRCMREQAVHATLASEVRALREKSDFLTRVLWGAVAWIVLSAAGVLLAALGR